MGRIRTFKDVSRDKGDVPMLNRVQIKESLMTSIRNNKPIIGVAVGSGLSAKQATEGGADFLLVLNAGRFRTIGISSTGCMMPFGNSNDIVMKFGGEEVLPRVIGKPVIFGFCATDPMVDQSVLIERIIKKGFSGVNNFPTVGLIDGHFREALEENDLGFDQEVEFMKKAIRRGLFTIAFVFNEEQAETMAEADVDVICAHLGWTVGGEQSVKPRTTLEEGVKLANRIFMAANRVKPAVLNMVYGGPIKNPEDASFFYQNSSAIGYIGGSSFERIPTETVIKETTDNFKNYVRLMKENEILKKELIKKKGFDEIVGQSRVMQDIYDIINKVADKDINVLVHGESGTGKELVVRAIHFNSLRYKGPFIKVNCAALPDGILESELFGHEKGAFTGAHQQKIGRFELANHGTLLLDEIGEMSHKTQAKLLRAIQELEIERVGGEKTIKVDVRIICATNVDIQKYVSDGRLREDLYYRINAISINMPPLREHKEDIALLVHHFLKRINEKFQKKITRLTPAALDCLMQYDWPGNIRELEHALERAAVLCDGEVIGIPDLPLHIQNINSHQERFFSEGQMIQFANANMKTMERQLVIDALEKFGWNRTKTAHYLGITRRTLYNKIIHYQIQ